MKKPIEAKIECPFYIEEGERYIRCEGMINGTQCTHRFISNERKSRFEERICSVFGGRNCPHYRALCVLYEKEVRV